jgi:hypothetical protein
LAARLAVPITTKLRATTDHRRFTTGRADIEDGATPTSSAIRSPR